MASTTTTSPPATSTTSSLLLRRLPPPLPRSLPSPHHPKASSLVRMRTVCQVAITSDASSPSAADVAAEEAEAASKLEKRVRVTAPVKVHHVSKAPELDLCGMEGVVKQYVGVWKGRRITANLPFKVQFELNLDGQSKPVRFFAHLREEEFEFVDAATD